MFMFQVNVWPNVNTLDEQFSMICQVWSSRKFKGSVSPHELVQEVSKASKKRFRIGKQSDAVQFLAWLLNELHRVSFA